MANRAFAFDDGGTPDGFTENGGLLWETSQGSATAALNGDLNGNVYWGGPEEDTGSTNMILAYAATPATHTGANAASSKVQFWQFVEADWIAGASAVSQQELGGVEAQTFATRDDATNTFNATAGYHVVLTSP
tara:strand:+ start:93 stop:491 length:399 start_codon:yes stop_codon:yes gene_type:complete